jgi:hypothetical protein
MIVCHDFLPHFFIPQCFSRATVCVSSGWGEIGSETETCRSSGKAQKTR